jgi:hypothetical protein
MSTITRPLIVYIPDTRGVQVSRFGRGNLKIGPNVFTYSRLPGRPNRTALGAPGSRPISRDMLNSEIPFNRGTSHTGTCPGSTPECESICYASRPVAENGAVFEMWERNSLTSEVPPIPEEAEVVRAHVSGDFDSVAYIENWIKRLQERPDVKFWAYTRSWRIPELLPALERLRALPNVQLFASMDKNTPTLPPVGWRRAWIWPNEPRINWTIGGILRGSCQTVLSDGTPSYVCPEQTGRKPNCESCRYCFDGNKHDVTFLLHTGAD